MADFDAENEYIWLGGSTTNALQLPLDSTSGYVTESTAAIIIMTKPDEKALDRGYLVDHMTGTYG